MSDDQMDSPPPAAPGDTKTDDQRAALLQQIQNEMSDMTPDELARLYAAIALMDLKQND